MVYARTAGRDTTRNVPTPREDRERYCLTDERGARAGRRGAGDRGPLQPPRRPADADGRRVGARTASTAGSTSCRRGPRRSARSARWASSTKCGWTRQAACASAGARSAAASPAGACASSATSRSSAQFQPGEVLVADTTMPDWGTVMKSAAAVVTNRGGRTCHAAIVARELGIPAVVGCDARDVDAAHRRRGHRVVAPRARPARSTRAGFRTRRRAPTCRRWRVRART